MPTEGNQICFLQKPQKTNKTKQNKNSMSKPFHCSVLSCLCGDAGRKASKGTNPIDCGRCVTWYAPSRRFVPTARKAKRTAFCTSVCVHCTFGRFLYRFQPAFVVCFCSVFVSCFNGKSLFSRSWSFPSMLAQNFPMWRAVVTSVALFRFYFRLLRSARLGKVSVFPFQHPQHTGVCQTCGA